MSGETGTEGIAKATSSTGNSPQVGAWAGSWGHTEVRVSAAVGA